MKCQLLTSSLADPHASLTDPSAVLALLCFWLPDGPDYVVLLGAAFHSPPCLTGSAGSLGGCAPGSTCCQCIDPLQLSFYYDTVLHSGSALSGEAPTGNTAGSHHRRVSLCPSA